MRKIIATCLLSAVMLMTFAPVFAGAQGQSLPITTNLEASAGSVSSDPIVVKAKWEMYTPGYLYGGSMPAVLGEDESSDLGAQFVAPGVWGENLEYQICAIVHGPSGNVDNIRDVYAEIFWPEDRRMHTSGHLYNDTTDKGRYNADGAEIDNPAGGCGRMIEQNQLVRLTQADGIDLVCNNIQTYNNSLIEWYNPYDYAEVCNPFDGQLIKNRARVYCHDKVLTWEDPAGDYEVQVFAYDTNNNRSNILVNRFTYLEEIGYEVDFNSVAYGPLAIGEHKKIYGNKFFNESYTSATPTIRNLGNTRIQISIAQDDMGLGYLDSAPSTWRVQYNARIGDLEEDWRTYDPTRQKGTSDSLAFTTLMELLDLSEIEEMDFSIKVSEKWPGNLQSYSGSMWLEAGIAQWDACPTT